MYSISIDKLKPTSLAPCLYLRTPYVSENSNFVSLHSSTIGRRTSSKDLVKDIVSVIPNHKEFGLCFRYVNFFQTLHVSEYIVNIKLFMLVNIL